MRFEKSFERFGGYQMFTYLCKKKVMEHYFLFSDAKPLEVRKLTAKVVIPRESTTTVVFKGAKPYENCLRVYDQEKGELHYYQPTDWVVVPCPQLSFFTAIDLGFEPLSKRYPFYAEESKEDITREELEQEVRKIAVDSQPSLCFDLFKYYNGSPFVGNKKGWGIGFGNGQSTSKSSLFDIEAIKKRIEELLPPTPKELEFCDRFWVKSYQCPDKRIYMEQYEDKKYPFLHTTDVGEEVLLIPDGDNYFYLYFDFKHEQRFDEKRNGTMVAKDCHPFFKLSPTLIEYYGENLEEFKSSRLKRLLSDDYVAVWNNSEFDIYPKSLTWNKSDYIPAAWIPNQDWVTNIYKRKK